MGMHIIVTGNPVDGFEFYGPFKTAMDASEWAASADLDDWWNAPLLAKEEAEP